MQASIRLGRIFGIEIGLHFSWVLIASLITFSLAARFSSQNPEWGKPMIVGLSIMTAMLFFAAIIVHELSHSVVARARGLPVKSITLFALGGVAQVEKEAPDAATEFLVAIVGPATSMIIGAICLLLTWLAGWPLLESPNQPLPAMLAWLGYINLLLAFFNLIPGFPMDGGRVLRAIIWWLTGDQTRASRFASAIGELVAVGFIALGIFRFLGGAGFGGLWLALIGWFLLNAARASYSHIDLMDELRGATVGDVMERNCVAVSSESNLQTLVDEQVLRSGLRCFAIVESGRFVGLVTLHEIMKIGRDRWPDTTVRNVMRPLENLLTATPDTTVSDALQTMSREDVNQLPVVLDGRLLGVITREHIIRLVQTRADLRREAASSHRSARRLVRIGGSGENAHENRRANARPSLGAGN